MPPKPSAKTAAKSAAQPKSGGPEAAPAPKHVYLIDGSGFIFRAYHAMAHSGRPLTRPDGTVVGAVLVFCNMILKLVGETDADHIAVIFDTSRQTFRSELYADYKAHRPEAPDDLIPQFAIIREAIDAFNLCRIEKDGYEADDLIAAYADEAVRQGARVTIVSSDKDLMQLVSDKVELYDAMRDKPIRAPEVMEKFGVAPDKVIEVQALIGDTSDNVPGVPGIGPKTAAELITAYGDVENLYKHLDEIKQPKRRQALSDNAENARLSKKLVTLDRKAPMPCPLSDLAVKPIDAAKVTPFLQAQGFRSLLTRVQAKLGATAPALPAPGQSDAPHPPPLPASKAPIPASDPTAAAARLAAAEKKYELIQETDALDRWIAKAFAKGAVAVDTETTSLNAALADLVGVSLALEPGEACYIPVDHKNAAEGGLDLAGVPRPKQIPLQTVIAKLKPLLEDDSVLKIGQNIKYDLEVLARYGIKVAPVDCTMLISFVLDAGLHGHGLDELAKLHFGHSMIAYKDVAGSGKNHKGFAAVPLDKACDYSAEDADYTLRLHRLLKPRLVDGHRVAFYETVERPLPPVVAGMEACGIMVDRVELKRLSDDFAKRIVEFEARIHKLAGHPFNVGSPQQLGKVLFEELKLSSGKKTKTGAYGTDASVLEELAEEHELPARVLDWRELSKLKSTYTDALVEQINPVTGRVHTSYSLTGAATGRLASSDPNLQNIPIRTEEGRKIRHAFIADKGQVLISADYSQIELRLAAHVADIPALKAAFKQGLDIHAMTASEVFGVPIKGMDPNLRRRAKAINFGILYGISAFGLGRQIDVPHGEAAQYIKAYFERFPGIRNYMDRTKEFARSNGYVETIFGRRCYTPGIKDPLPARRGFAERAAINAPLQGAAADIIKRAMRRIPSALEQAGLKARMLLQVHDELVFEAPSGEAEQTAKLVKAIMENAASPAVELSVPLVVDTGMGHHWDEAH